MSRASLKEAKAGKNNYREPEPLNLSRAGSLELGFFRVSYDKDKQKFLQDKEVFIIQKYII